MRPKLTILIPAYNAKGTIRRTLSSLDAQIDKDFEVMILSDGSTDATDFIAYNWCCGRAGYRFLKGEHSGVGATRERLFRECDTEYVTFLDADDVLMPYATKFMNDAIRKFDEDILVFRFHKELENELVLFSEQRGLTWCFGKVYKSEFIKANGITFDPGLRTGEDSYFNAIAFEFGTHRVVPISVAVWCNNPNSITRKDGEGGFFDIMADNIKGMTMALQVVKKRKSLRDIKLIQPNLNRIRENLAIMKSKFEPKQVEKLTTLYEEFIKECTCEHD